MCTLKNRNGGPSLSSSCDGCFGAKVAAFRSFIPTTGCVHSLYDVVPPYFRSAPKGGACAEPRTALEFSSTPKTFSS